MQSDVSVGLGVAGRMGWAVEAAPSVSDTDLELLDSTRQGRPAAFRLRQPQPPHPFPPTASPTPRRPPHLHLWRPRVPREPLELADGVGLAAAEELLAVHEGGAEVLLLG
jgi:hypothetical protein